MPEPFDKSPRPPSEFVYYAKDVTIRLAHGASSAELPGEVWVERDGLVCWKTSAVVVTDQTMWLMPLQLVTSEVATYLKLEARVEDGGEISSNYAFITNHSPTAFPDKPSTIAGSGQIARAKLTMLPSLKLRQAYWWFIARWA